jgi:hypothetical protein
MKNFSRLILVLLVTLILIGGFLLFLFRHSIADNLRDKIELIPILPASSIVISPAEALDLSLLQQPKFVALVNHSADFDFNNICWRPDSGVAVQAPSVVGEATSTEATSTPKNTRIIKCVDGNPSPFIRSGE